MKAKRKQPIRPTLSLLWWIFMLVLAIAVIGIIADRAQGRVPEVFGYSVMYVISGSMEEEIPIGSYILVGRVSASDIAPGDIISFYSDDPDILGMPNTHRVVERVELTGGDMAFTTKGDASPAPDKYPVKEDRIIGRYICTLDALGGVLSFISSGGAFIIIMVLVALMAGFYAYTLIVKRDGTGDKED